MRFVRREREPEVRMDERDVHLTEEDVRHVARLARIELAAGEERLYAEQLSAILTYVHTLERLDVRDVAPMAHAREASNVLREDVARPGCGADAALREAPSKQDGYLRVPKVLDGGEA